MLRFSFVSHRHGCQNSPAMDGFCALPTRPQGNTLLGMGARIAGNMRFMMPAFRADGTTLPAAWRYTNYVGADTSGTIPMVGLLAETGAGIDAGDTVAFTGNMFADLSGQFVGGMDRVDGFYLPSMLGAVVAKAVAERGTSANLVNGTEETPEPQLGTQLEAGFENAGLATDVTTAINQGESSDFSSIGSVAGSVARPTAHYQRYQSYAQQGRKAVPRAFVRHDAEWGLPAGRPPG